MDKSRLMLIVIIALLVILIGTVVGTTLFLLSGNETDPDIFAEMPEVVHPAQRTNLMDLIEVTLGERISTNLAATPDGRVAMVLSEVALGIDSQADPSDVEPFIINLNARIGMARSIVINEFGRAFYEDINSTEGQLALAETMAVALREAFETNLIVRVFFSDWKVSRR